MLSLIINSILLGFGLAMDAFSVSLANGLREPKMDVKRMLGISSVYGIYQTLMPLIGWFCVRTVFSLFSQLQKFIPWIALVLLLYLGIKMIFEGIKGEDIEDSNDLSFYTLMLQGVATSIDALSVGFTISNYTFAKAFVESLIIGIVTLIICYLGLMIGKKFGTKLAGKANILGGAILILIGIKIFFIG